MIHIHSILTREIKIRDLSDVKERYAGEGMHLMGWSETEKETATIKGINDPIGVKKKTPLNIPCGVFSRVSTGFHLRGTTRRNR